MLKQLTLKDFQKNFKQKEPATSTYASQTARKGWVKFYFLSTRAWYSCACCGVNL